VITGAKEIRVAIVSAVGVKRVVGLYFSMAKCAGLVLQTWGSGGGGGGTGLCKLHKFSLKPQ
jgi:hypothetical protein